MLFVDASCAVRLPHPCQVVTLNRLFVELTDRDLEYGNRYSAQDPMARLTGVILDELANLRASPLVLPIAQDPRLEKAMQHLLRHQSATVKLEELAEVAGASLRTLARLSRGDSITAVALDLGYTTSSFVYMFRQNIGLAPGKWLAHQAHDAYAPLHE